MTERMRLIRTITRFLLAESLIGAVVIATILIVRELPSDPSAALIGLLGTIFGGLTTALGFLINSISRNSSDSDDSGKDD